MAGEASKDVIKIEASEVEPISVQRCSSLVPETERIRYKECRRNHAASFGRYAFDGCGEFIGCNDDAFMCAACGCHRSFHRKEPPNNLNNAALPPPHQPMPPQKPLLAPLPLASHNGLTGETSLFPRDRNIDAGSETLSGAEVEEPKDTKKRAKRTRITMEQKTKMMRFADKLGWRPQKHDDAEVQQFCEEVGITKRVFVVWLNNNRRRKDSMRSEEQAWAHAVAENNNMSAAQN
ncbi:PREDICTED: zinc-finger homeodomain protein 5 [Theobroma cacao]|uniref:Zinc-finger homeodomain protein 5 n=1 Tax=Theobroma cacao TaxID=3641 RepID=A0AB32VGJ1_THECC|nr:PREDICTED: zinc-finger homeodomain protein 5 [Theobroma cacao]